MEKVIANRRVKYRELDFRNGGYEGVLDISLDLNEQRNLVGWITKNLEFSNYWLHGISNYDMYLPKYRASYLLKSGSEGVEHEKAVLSWSFVLKLIDEPHEIFFSDNLPFIRIEANGQIIDPSQEEIFVTGDVEEYLNGKVSVIHENGNRQPTH